MKKKYISLPAAVPAFILLIALTACRSGRTVTDSALYEPQNGIPLVIIRVDESSTSIADMNSSEDHSVRCTGTVEINVPEGYSSGYGDDTVPAGEIELEYIRGRGNYTWSTDPDAKRPYRIKFAEKQNLFGMGSSKDWALIANAEDDTLMKNRIVLWLGEQLGFRYTPQMIPADVVMIGSESGVSELGSYCLSELVSAKRLDVPDAKMIAMYYEIQNLGEPFFTTNAGLEIKYDDPEEENEQVKAFVNDLEAEIIGSDSIDEAVHADIAAKMDMKSAADYWWIQEYSCNGDAFATDSTYMYIDPDNGWKLFWGPLWDFDLSMGNEDDDTEAETTIGFNNTGMLWLDQLRYKDPQFAELLKERWNGSEDPDNRGLNQLLKEITEEGGRLDQMKDQLRASWERDHAIRKVSDPDKEETDFDTAAENLRKWIEQRRIWMCDHLGRLNEVYYTVTYTADGNIIGSELVRDGGWPMLTDAPEKEGYLFVRWQKKGSEEEVGFIRITEDTEVEAVYIREDEAVEPEAVWFTRKEDWAALSREEYWSNAETVIPENAASPKSIWTSSDETVATVNDDGTVTLLSEGDTEITVTLYNGVSDSFLLHVYDDHKISPAAPEGVSAVPKSLILKPGQTEKIGCSLLPEGGIFKGFDVHYEIAVPDIAEIDEFTGIITGRKPGTAVVTVNLLTEDGETDMKDSCTVTVSEDGDS